MKLDRIYTIKCGEFTEIRADFDNDRHVAVEIEHPCDLKQVAEALRKFTNIVYREAWNEEK